MVVDVVQNPQRRNEHEYEKKHVRRDSQDVLLLLLLSFLLWFFDDRRYNTRTRTPRCIADCPLQVLRSRPVTNDYL